MDIKYLQQLDYLLKYIGNNTSNYSNRYKLIFEYNNFIYEGDFIPELRALNVVLKDVTSFDDDELNLISLKNENAFETIRKHQSLFGKSYLKLLTERVNEYEPQDYFRLLVDSLEKYPVEFENELPPYIYNLKSENQIHPLSLEIMKIPSDAQFSFVSIIKINEE
ncbi:hypothetical protein CD149_06040 [Staphylococcus condimenti]|uniref:Uncharacterized protein n=2 Tax=Staphylococcus condimenti TaxID=70255 RepID=A0AB37H3G5_9STAP|nr:MULTISPECIES: hypothetical protein [Staphylococcus]AMY05104.1 hypothetical protein A4G25_03825 [Staphylococcus condimenti]APR61297.1 hypothetical protein BTZ13_08775 [Staphylococcus condimenti]MDK8645785.1 hypothetical protein [Staphylococcus condimenti]OFP02367.1 hypothetical protein HMPREF3007_03750 [Staphylococcus sp. HMSC065E08]PNZ60981.1 hypothetical protein CD149_06040 [Staphylococcus condimenti]